MRSTFSVENAAYESQIFDMRSSLHRIGYGWILHSHRDASASKLEGIWLGSEDPYPDLPMRNWCWICWNGEGRALSVPPCHWLRPQPRFLTLGFFRFQPESRMTTFGRSDFP